MEPTTQNNHSANSNKEFAEAETRFHLLLDRHENTYPAVQRARAKAVTRIHKYQYGHVTNFDAIEEACESFSDTGRAYARNTSVLARRWKELTARRFGITSGVDRILLRTWEIYQRLGQDLLALLERLLSVATGVRDDEQIRILGNFIRHLYRVQDTNGSRIATWQMVLMSDAIPSSGHEERQGEKHQEEADSAAE